MIISTIYDKDLKQKVFQVRDEERYTNSTITTISNTYVANHRSYLTVNLTASVKHHIGESSVAFYDGENYLGVVNCNSTDNSVTLTSNVGYGYHKFWAKYLGNTQCLSSKSQISELSVYEPNLPTPTMTITAGTGSYPSLTGTLKNPTTNTGIANATITILINNQTQTITTNSNGAFSYTHSTNTAGRYIMSCSFEGNDEYLAANAETYADIGHDVTITPVYPKIAVGDTTKFKVNVRTWDTEPVEDLTLTLGDG